MKNIKISSSETPPVDTSATTATTDGGGTDDHLPTAAEQAALLDAFLGCGCVHPTGLQLTPAETTAVLAALKADPDVLAMVPELHSRRKDTHRYPLCDRELRPLAAAIVKALLAVKPILLLTDEREERAAAAMMAIVMEAPEFEIVTTQKSMAAPLTKAIAEALRAVKPLLKVPKRRQKYLVDELASHLMEATQFDNAAVTKRMMAHFATWMPKNELLKLKQALGQHPHNRLADKAREYFASHEEKWEREEYVYDEMLRLLRDACPHIATDWRIEWKKGADKDDERILQQDGPDKCLALLCSLHAVSIEDVWRYRNHEYRYNNEALEIIINDRFELCGKSKRLIDHFVEPLGDRLVDVAVTTAEGRALVAALDSGRVGIIAGESGGGKSITAAMVAARPMAANPPPSGLVIALAITAAEIFEGVTSISPDPESFPAEVHDCVVKWVLYRLGQCETSRLKACGARLTVIVEEVGEYAACVQGLCVVRAAVRQRLMNVLRVRDVQFICVGTGADLPTRAWAAPPDAYHRIHVRPFLWPHLCEAFEDNEKTTPALRRVLEIIADVRHDHHRLVWLRALLENARYAALFANTLDGVSTKNYNTDDPASIVGCYQYKIHYGGHKINKNTVPVLRAAFADSSPDDDALIAAINLVAQQALAHFFGLKYLWKATPADLNSFRGIDEPDIAQTLRDALQGLLDRALPPILPSGRHGGVTCESRYGRRRQGDGTMGIGCSTTDEPIAEVPVLMPVEKAVAGHTSESEPPTKPQVTVAPEPLLEVLRRGRAYLHVSAATAAMFLMLLQRDSPTDVSHPAAARALLLALTDYAAICASLAALEEEHAVAPITASTAAARGVPALRRIIDGLGVRELRDGPYKGLWGFNVELATIHIAGNPIDHHTVPAAGGAGSEVLDAAFEAYAKAATRPRDRHAVVIVNHPTAEHAPVLVAGPTKLVLLHAVTGRLAPDIVASVLRAVVPLCAVDGSGGPRYHQAKQHGAPVTDAALDDDARCSAQRQRTTEALVEKASGVQLRTVAKYDRMKKAPKRCRDDDDGTASATTDDSSPIEELARMPAADTTAVDFTVDTVVVYEGAAAPEMALAANGRCKHPDVGGTELRVQYIRADDGTAFVVRYRYFVLDVTWRREGGRTGPLHDDEPLPPLYPVHQTAFAASE